MIKKVCLKIIKIYQTIISPLYGDVCRFYPSCSEYSYLAIKKYGVLKGGKLTAKRLSKCHPWHSGGVDIP